MQGLSNLVVPVIGCKSVPDVLQERWSKVHNKTVGGVLDPPQGTVSSLQGSSDAVPVQVVEVEPCDTSGSIGEQGPVPNDFKILTHVPKRMKGFQNGICTPLILSKCKEDRSH